MFNLFSPWIKNNSSLFDGNNNHSLMYLGSPVNVDSLFIKSIVSKLPFI
jgi:hypothetical protein